MSNPAYASFRRRRLLVGLGVIAAMLLLASFASMFNSTVADYVSEDAVIARIERAAVGKTAGGHISPPEPMQTR